MQNAKCAFGSGRRFYRCIPRDGELPMAYLRFPLTFLFLALVLQAAPAEEPAVDLGGVTERHEMVPMRDGVRLSTYLYFPRGKGPWPVLYEQRYADTRGAETRKSFARLAAAGY